MRAALGMIVMIGSVVITIPAMALAIRRSPEAFFWTGVAGLAVNALGRWIYGW